MALKTQKELSKGVLVGAFDSVAALHLSIRAAAPNVSFDESYPLLMNRFGVEQKGAIRAVDDAKSNGANAATRMVETAPTTHFYYPAVVARAVAELSRQLGRPVPAMTVTLLDLAMAYRTIPSAQPWFTCVAYFDPFLSPPRPALYWLPGHNFGLVSAVVNFQRYPELIVSASRALHGVPAEHYVDDFLLPDLAAGGQSAQLSIESLVLSLGSGAHRAPGAAVRCPEIDPEKTHPASSVNVVLGVVTNLSTLHTNGVVSFRVDESRVVRVLDSFRASFERGVLSPHEASQLRGKLFFLLSAAYAMVGRAATLPLVQRQYRESDYSFAIGSELHHCYLFFSALLPRLPPLTFGLNPDPTPPLTVYTDASFWVERRGAAQSCGNRRSRRFRGALGAVVYDPVDRTARFAAADPPWELLLSSWRTDRKTYIAELEALAAISVYSTYPTLFAGRKVSHWIDNTVALSALVHGYSGKPDLAKSVNVFYLQMVGLRASVYFEYVPSKANIADLPSRDAFGELYAELAGFRIVGAAPDVLRVPTVASWRAPLRAWARSPVPGARVPV